MQPDKIREALRGGHKAACDAYHMTKQGYHTSEELKPYKDIAEDCTAALKEIEEVDVDFIRVNHSELYDKIYDKGYSACESYLHQRGMLRAGVEKIEGLEEAYEDLRLNGFRNMDLENKVIIKEAARKYLAMEKNDD